MTTQTAAYSGSNNSGGGFIGKLLIVVFVALGAFTLLAIADGLGGAVVDTTPAGQEEQAFGAWLMISAAPPVELTGVHADRTHQEAAMVRKTCREQGVYQVWRETYDKSTFHLLCLTIDGKLVDWIITVVAGRFIEKTAFAPRAGVMAEVLKYVASKATRFTKGW